MESDDSFFLPLLIQRMCLLLIDVTQMGVLSVASSDTRHAEERRERKRQGRGGEKQLSPSVLEWLPLGLKGEADSLALHLAPAAAAGCWPVGERITEDNTDSQPSCKSCLTVFCSICTR